MQEPSVGRTVHYMPLEGQAINGHRAAIVTNVIPEDEVHVLTEAERVAGFVEEDPEEEPAHRVNCTVFMDGANDGEHFRKSPLLLVESSPYSEGLEPGTWHYPERVEEVPAQGQAEELTEPKEPKARARKPKDADNENTNPTE